MVISAGITIAVAAGEFDLSLGQVASMSMIILMGLIIRQEQGTFIAIVPSLPGFVICLLRWTSCDPCQGAIADLYYRYRGYWHGRELCLRQRRLHLRPCTDDFTFIGQGFIGPIPFSVIFSLIILLGLYFFLNHTGRGAISSRRAEIRRRHGFPA